MAVLALIVPALVPAAHGSASAAVDAGTTLLATVDAPFPLRGFVEGFDGPVTLQWLADADCMVLDPAALETEAACATPGPHVFALHAEDATQSASDSVRVEVTREVVTPVFHAAGTAPAPQLNAVTLPGRTFVAPAGLTRLVATLDWEDNSPIHENLDLSLSQLSRSERAMTDEKPEVLVVEAPAAGPWTARVDGRTALNTPWTLSVVGVVQEGHVDLPRVQVPGVSGDLGETVTLTARVEGAAGHAIAWETDASSRRFDDGAGATLSLAVTGPQLVRAKVTDADGREVVAAGMVRVRGDFPEPFTVVAVIDNWFSPYHYDFLGAQHPWNLDADPANDVDFHAPPQTYLPGMPATATLPLTLPQGPDEDVAALRLGADAGLWTAMQSSNLSSPKPYWLPGTKVVAALRFGPEPFHDGVQSHGTQSASVAAGNVHGTCPECLVVLISADDDRARDEALAWAAAQRWIDVVTNSYGTSHPLLGFSPLTRDNLYWEAPVRATRDASEAGQVIVFSAGNGLLNTYDVPTPTYWSSQKGPDWMVTVGSIAAHSNQTFSGSGKPVDVSASGNRYPSAGGTTANGKGTHSGTSNAAPVMAGHIAKVVQEARRALGDLTPGHGGGVLASGAPVACGAAEPACALGDGVLTRVEVEDVVYANVLPTGEGASLDPIWPTTPYAYAYQGHGAIVGRFWGDDAWKAEWGRAAANMRGEVAAHPRPEGEANWFVIDSKCRQRIWGAWSGGDWNGTQPQLDPVRDPLALQLDALCSRIPATPFGAR